MKPNTKYVSGSTQYAMYPNPIMNITQTIGGSRSHLGTNAIDDAQEDGGISNGYAPCDVKCVAFQSYGNFTMWESINPIQTAKRGIQNIHFYVGHDNVQSAYIGKIVLQGEKLFSEGTAGRTTGNHNHIEVSLGKYSGTFYVLNSYGVYMLPGNINPAEVFFVNDTQLLDGGGLSWIKTSEITKRKQVYTINAVTSYNNIWQLKCDYLVPVDFLMGG